MDVDVITRLLSNHRQPIIFGAGSARRQLDAEVDIVTVQKLAGYASPVTTTKYRVFREISEASVP